MTPQRDAFEAWCAGDPSAGPALLALLQSLSRQILSRYAHQSVSAADADDHIQVVMTRLWDQRGRKLDEAALITDDPALRCKMLRQAAVRGADEAAMVNALGRALDDEEKASLSGRLGSEGSVRAYLRQAFRNRFNRILQQHKRTTQFDADRPIAAPPPSAPEFSEEALDLLERLLGEFEDWGNDRSSGAAQPGTRNMQSLEELGWAFRDGLSAQAITARLQPDLTGDALRKAGGARGRAWRRARERFHTFIDEVRLKRHERSLVDEVRVAFDDRYRLRARSAVRKQGAARPPAQRSDP